MSARHAPPSVCRGTRRGLSRQRSCDRRHRSRRRAPPRRLLRPCRRAADARSPLPEPRQSRRSPTTARPRSRPHRRRHPMKAPPPGGHDFTSEGKALYVVGACGEGAGARGLPEGAAREALRRHHEGADRLHRLVGEAGARVLRGARPQGHPEDGRVSVRGRRSVDGADRLSRRRRDHDALARARRRSARHRRAQGQGPRARARQGRVRAEVPLPRELLEHDEHDRGDARRLAADRADLRAQRDEDPRLRDRRAALLQDQRRRHDPLPRRRRHREGAAIR